MRKILILEDNEKSYEMLAQILRELDDTVNILYASETAEAYSLCMGNQIDLFLLDIILQPKKPGDISGLRFAESVRKIRGYEFTPIIFITSMEDPKLYAYSDLHCYSFIEKPYDVERTRETIREALKMPLSCEQKEYIYFRRDNILYKKDADDIIYIENSRSGQVLHAVDGDICLPYRTCRDILKELNRERFVQCSRFIIVNWAYVENIDRINRYIKLTGVTKRIEAGRTYLEKIMREKRI